LEAIMAFEAAREAGPVSLFTRARTPTVGLPNGVAAKLLSVQELGDAAHRHMRLFEERHEANTARGDAQRRLDRVLAHQSDGGFHLDPSDTRVTAQQRLVEEATAAAKRLNDRYQRTSQAYHVAAKVRATCEEWLKVRPRGTVIEDAPEPEATLQKNEDLFGGIARLERRARELRADLARISAAPFPSTVGNALVRSWMAWHRRVRPW
jgi:hypothetical protein